MIQLTQFSLIKSFASSRLAHCRNCTDENFDRKPIKPGEKRITLQASYNRTLYLCPDCAAFEADKLEALAADLRRAVAGWIDTEDEWNERRLVLA